MFLKFREAHLLDKGELFICIDDDYYVNNGLEIINNEWKKIKNFYQYAGMGFLCAYDATNIIGTRFPKDSFDSNHIDIYSKYKVKGDKVLVFRTSILRNYPFPILKKEKFITEAIVYNRIAQKYKCRYINKVIEIKEYRPDGLSRNINEIKKNILLVIYCIIMST